MATDPIEIRSAPGCNPTWGLLDHLGKLIVTGADTGKTVATEAELSKPQGVSRSVTREAVKMLGTKGLPSARPGQGTFVQPASSWTLFDADVVSWLIETQPDRA
ncbi:MAG: hypothetical protein B7Y47_01125 [Sphingomonas sp. 28-63-12]|nr:MAG: hypothetical protein B7Y47_01125 [Sphingomonas sp. 28-63-12]